MSTSTPSAESLKTIQAQARKRALQINKACALCRLRKTKCDAAVVGLPCSSCKSRQCAEECVSLVRKSRIRKRPHSSSTPGQITGSPAASEHPQSESHPASDGIDRQSTGQPGPDVLYLQILSDAVEEVQASSQLDTTSTTPSRSELEEDSTRRDRLSTTLSHLDGTDRDYLTKKGVFDLPPSPHLDALIKTYFDYVHPFAPVISRADFDRRYQSGHYSLLLLRVILTTASLHAPADVLFACGFTSRSAAQESFFSRARLLYDFTSEGDPLSLLQASIVLCNVMLEQPTDRDFGYWFHNAIRLADKLNLRHLASERARPREALKLYRSIWQALYCLDIFHAFINARRSRLLEDSPDIRLGAENDWEDESFSGKPSGVLSAASSQQKASPAALCELSQMCACCYHAISWGVTKICSVGDCLSTVKSRPQQDPRQMMHSIDAWRTSLASKMHVGVNAGTDVCYLNVQAISYRYECILCRLMWRTWQRSERADCHEWIKQRFRSAILELDTISMRMLASGTIEKFHIALITTIAALLALHIESALDSTETHLIRSMSRISISQTMLVLNQGREIPVLKRALPLFEEILTRNNLLLTPPNSLGQPNLQVSAQPPSQDKRMTDACTISPHREPRRPSIPEMNHWDNNQPFNIEFLGVDFLDGSLDFLDASSGFFEEWPQSGQPDFAG